MIAVTQAWRTIMKDYNLTSVLSVSLSKFTDGERPYPFRFTFENPLSCETLVWKQFKPDGKVWYIKYTERSITSDRNNWRTKSQVEVSIGDIMKFTKKVESLCMPKGFSIPLCVHLYYGEGEHRAVLEVVNTENRQHNLYVVHYSNEFKVLSEKIWVGSTIEKVSRYWDMERVGIIQYDGLRDKIEPPAGFESVVKSELKPGASLRPQDAVALARSLVKGYESLLRRLYQMFNGSIRTSRDL